MYSVARLCPDQSFLLCHRRHVAGLSMLYKVNSNSNHCLFSELLSDNNVLLSMEQHHVKLNSEVAYPKGHVRAPPIPNTCI